MNVESSHCYPDCDAFFKGVHHVLKEDGLFLFADFRYQEEMEPMLENIAKYFTIVNYQDIRMNVHKALLLQNITPKERVDLFPYNMFPWWAQSIATQFLAIDGSEMRDEIRDGVRAYFAYAFKKK